MSDNHQAELLARWLSESGRGEPAPDGLDADAVEAVLALRPDLAPPARVDIDDILGAVEEGPFAMSMGSEGAALADWLDGGVFDETLDEDIQETVFALRPDLAPAPRVDMDDIFGAVTQGPFAQPAVPEEPVVAPVVSLAEVRQQRAFRRKWWAPVGAIAAAAAALLMINPAVMNLPEPTQDLALEQGTVPAAASAPAAEPTVTVPSASPADDQRYEGLEERKDEINQDIVGKDDLRRGEAPVGGESQEPLAASTGSTVPEPEPVEADLADDLDRNNSGLIDAPVASQAPTQAAKPAKEGTESLEALGYVGDSSGHGAGGLDAAPDADDEAGNVEHFATVDETLELSTAVAESSYSYDNEAEGDVSRESATRTRDRGGITMPRLGRNQGSAAADAPASVPMDSVPMEEAEAFAEGEADRSVSLADTTDDMPDLGQAAVLDRLRASAGSLRPVPDVGAKYPDLVVAYAAADAEWNAGRMDVAIGLLAPFAVHPDPDVVLDVTYNHALMRYRTGEIPTALQVIAQGLRVSGGDGLLRSRLYVLQGTLLERRGQPEQAIQSYRQAVEVR